MAWSRRVFSTFRRRTVIGDIDREMAFHVAERAEQLRQEGLNDAEAWRRARLQFGNPVVQRERTRDVDVAEWLDTLLRNLRQTARGLLRTKAFTATVAVTLAVGIGANAAVFSAIHAVLLRPLPFPDPDRLVRLTQVTDDSGEIDTAAVRLDEWSRLSSTFVAITPYTLEDVSDTTGETPQAVHRATVGPKFLEIVGIPPAIGRGFTDAEHRLGGPDVALISDRYWRSRFNADPNVLGRVVRMTNRAYAIVGVLPPDFAFPADVDWWTPQWMNAPWTQSRQLAYSGVGRLRPGVSFEQGRADLEAVQARLAQQFPETDRGLRPHVTPLKDTYVGRVRASLWLLFGSVSLLLLIACTNIAGLLLTRAMRRQQEIAIRRALGSSRRALALQLLTESVVLAILGGALGVVLAIAMVAGIRTLAPSFPRLDDVTLSAPVWIYLAVVTIAVATVCGLIPAFRTPPLHTARTGTRTQVSFRQPLHWWLVGVQVTLAVTLLAGAGLLVRSLDRLSRVDAGFESARVLTFRITGSLGEQADATLLGQRINRTLDALATLPGVDAAAMAIKLPGLPLKVGTPVVMSEAPTADGSQRIAELQFISPSYFQVMGIPVRRGELCRLSALNRPSEYMVNQAFATRYFPGQSIIGRHLAFGAFLNTPGRIAGVVANAHEVGLDVEAVPTVYPCFAPTPTPWFLVRSAPGRAVAIADVRAALRTVDPLRSVYDVAALDTRIGAVHAPVRLRTTLLALFAITALLLACLGVYGALTYVVSLREREAALRLALGASRWGLVGQLCGPAVRVIGAACGAGLLLSTAVARALAGMLFGVSPVDPLALSGVAVLVLVVGAIAVLLPSMRVAMAEPAQALRGEP
jgi:putative ABC transport system permease protein